MSGQDRRARTPVAGGRVERRLLSAALLVGAPAEVLDFLLPLWAGSALNASAAAVGALTAVEAALSLVVRPLAGELCDRRDPRRVAAAGAVLQAVSLAGYALADGLPLAFAAAATGGAGGALFWVALRTSVAAGLPQRAYTAAYGALLSAEGKGALVGYLAAFALLDRGGYPVLFWSGAAVCAAAAVGLAAMPAGPGGGPTATAGITHGARDTAPPMRRTTPLLCVTALTAAAEAGLWMVLLLRLQEESRMAPVEIAGVFAPGFLVLVVLPEYTHRVTDRIGRTRTLVVSFAAGALFAAGLGTVASPVAVSVLWALTAACLAAQIPVEQATAAAVAGDRPGRGIGRYESARLVGVVVGSGVLGVLYGTGGWPAVCLTAAAAFACGAAAVPHAIRVLHLDPVVADRTGVTDVTDVTEPPAGRSPEASGDGDGAARDKASVERRRWYVHTGAFAVGQTVLRALEVLPDVTRVWVTVYIIDTLWSWSYTVFPRSREGRSKDRQSGE